ncbi:sensor histidine kinase [Ornithinimicrobium ciconiae]|uniref:histidine kinase n=1 Tax=Ornithinimicrobium ciconiae TaxID=2594265 RepID=A0A516GE74_9MICO|nr:sensor histidine kinase [Ornithinimicrobium ciconiae]QDO89824.1 sensor histidine kinase [Ornithinimicrobium ciconiae]
MWLNRLSLTKQLLVLQVVIIVIALGAVVPVVYAQSTHDFRRSAGNRVLALAETFATDSIVRGGLRGMFPSGTIAPAATRVQSVSGADFVVVLTSDGIVTASQVPEHLDEGWDFEDSAVVEGRAWVGVQDLDGRSTVQAHVPVLDADSGRRLGYVVVGRYYPSFTSQLNANAPDLLAYLAVAIVLGVAGSTLLANRIKRQTLGLEPREIVGLVENREAFLYGIREGVVGLDLNDSVTLANDKALELLGLDGDVIGRRMDHLGLPEQVSSAFMKDRGSGEQVLNAGPRVVVTSRMPVHSRGELIGSVTTLRDRTEIVNLRHELDVTRHTSDALRAQTHEFSNRLHTISGLLKIGRPERAQQYVNDLRAAHNQLLHDVTSRIADPTVAALIVAKSSVASERGVSFRIASRTRLGVVPLDVAADLETILGNFVENALDAVAGRTGPWIEMALHEEGGFIIIEVRDSGPGIADEVLDSLFQAGVSTKAQDQSRGIGLALARHVCLKRGGEIDACNDPGAVFTARLPWPQRPQR